MLLIGIDPGATGGIATYFTGAESPVITYKMPQTETEIYQLIASLGPSAIFQSKALIEEITTWGMQANAQCMLYGNYKFLRACLISMGIPFDDVPPKQWQKEVGITYPKGTLYNIRKKIAREKAQQMYPKLKVDASNADALLILEFLRRREVR